MKNYKLNNTIPFQKRENSDNEERPKKSIHASKKIVSLSSYKKSKTKKDYLNNSKIKLDKKKLNKNFFMIIFVALIVLIVLSSLWGENFTNSANTYHQADANNVLNVIEAPTYKSIASKTVAKYTGNKYDVYVSELHKNGPLVYANGYLDVPNEGKVYYDLILDNSTPLSLKINGLEYVK